VARALPIAKGMIGINTAFRFFAVQGSAEALLPLANRSESKNNRTGKLCQGLLKHRSHEKFI
jgi:hypothetical protein